MFYILCHQLHQKLTKWDNKKYSLHMYFFIVPFCQFLVYSIDVKYINQTILRTYKDHKYTIPNL